MKRRNILSRHRLKNTDFACLWFIAAEAYLE